MLNLVRELRALQCNASLACPASATTVAAEAEASGVPTQSWASSLRARVRIVHVHDGRSAVLGRLLARDTDVVLVRTQHFVRPASAVRRGWAGHISRVVQGLVNRRVAGYVAVSRAVEAAALVRGEAQAAEVRVIPSGISLPGADVVAAARVSRERDSVPVVASAGRLENERRFDVLLNAMAVIRRDRPECCLVIAGSGSAEAKLKALADRLGIADAVRWTGWLPRIDPLLVRSHVYVNTWPWEGFGMATAEAMAFSLPVVAVRSGASTELVEDGVTGHLVPPNDPDSLAAAIVELIDDRTRGAVMGDHGRERAAKYSIDRVAASMLEFYRQLDSTQREN